MSIYLTITRAEYDDFPMVWFEGEFGSGCAEWRGDDFAEVGQEYICEIDTVGDMVWGESAFPSEKAADLILMDEDGSVIVNGRLDPFVRNEDGSVYCFDEEQKGLVGDVRIGAGLIAFNVYDIPLDRECTYIWFRTPGLSLWPIRYI